MSNKVGGTSWPRVVGYSNANIDIIIKVERLPGRDEKLKGSLLGKQPGGTMANYACAVSKLGIPAAWTGTLGNDQEAKLILENFQRHGVDTSTIRTVCDLPTMFAIILLDDSGERSIVVVPTIDEPVELTEEQLQLISRADVLYTGPYKGIPFYRVTEWARKNSTLVAIDVELTAELQKEELIGVLRHTDVAIFNQAVLQEIYGLDFRADNWRTYAELLYEFLRTGGLKLTGVTLGHAGSILVDAEEAWYVPGFTVPVIDSTGAGDCFNAALTVGFLRQWPLQRIGLYANAAGALAVQKMGSSGAMSTDAQVEAFLREHREEVVVKHFRFGKNH